MPGIQIDRDPANLYPTFAADLCRFISAWNLNHPNNQIGIFEGFRSFERQSKLYAQGRTDPGNIVTNAQAGMSWHNFGMAADVVFDSDPVKPGLQPTWDGKLPWPQMGSMAMAMGLEWAGSWKSFKEFPHVQKTFGLQLTEAQELFRQGGLPAVWAAI